MALNRFTRPSSSPSDLGGPSLTVQQFKEECDIASIIRKHRASGEPLPVNPNGVYLDMLSVPDDLQSALELCRDVAAQMDSLPIAARQRFNSDPVKFVEFLSDENNRAEAVRLGLVAPRQEESASVAPVSAPVTSAPEVTPPLAEK